MPGNWTVPVIEVYGPTIQGEGIDQGVPCHFVRFGGCDYKCEWCDSPHAVLPELVRKNSTRMTALEVVEQIKRLASGPEWIVFSGGNPALHDLGPLIAMLKLHGYRIAAETQGSRWKDWLARCDRVAVSPKPPSSGEFRPSFSTLQEFMRRLSPITAFLKVVIFDHDDYRYAQQVQRMFPEYQLFLSAGNDAGATVGNPGRVDERTDEQIMRDLVGRGRWLANRAMVDPIMATARVQVQNHVLYWGNERGR